MKMKKVCAKIQKNFSREQTQGEGNLLQMLSKFVGRTPTFLKKQCLVMRLASSSITQKQNTIDSDGKFQSL
jgi:hypothetical protein